MGGLVMPIPALAYGVLSGHGIWFPDQPAGRHRRSRHQRRAASLSSSSFSSVRSIVAIVIHATFSVTFGLLFGVVSPTLPPIPGGPVIAGGVLMPLLWSGLCHGFMGIINPPLQRHVDWFWFVVSQVVYGAGHVDRRRPNSEGPRPAGRKRPELAPPGSPAPARAEVTRELAARATLAVPAMRFAAVACFVRGLLLCCTSGCDLPGRPERGRSIGCGAE